MTLVRKFFTALLIIFPLSVIAQNAYQPSAFVEPDPYRKSEIAEAFRYYKNISPQLSVPGVLEISFSQEPFITPVFAIYNLDTNMFEPYLLVTNRIETKSTIQASGATGNPYYISDGNYETYLEFPLTENTSRAEMIFNFEKPITASSLYFGLDDFVALPQTVSVSAVETGRDHAILAPVKPHEESVVFPKTTASVWRVVFDYIQPLRISEMRFNDLSSGQTIDRSLRFLAQPGQSYQIYFDADRYVESTRREAGNLSSSKDIIYANPSTAVYNPEYRPVDSDNDGVPDLSDNCAGVFNPDQKDGDMNSRGDACEDYDRDGVLNSKDNCPLSPNYAQTDTDADGAGDICDSLDNRITERMPWLPWLGIGIAGLVLLGLFILVIKYSPKDNI